MIAAVRTVPTPLGDARVSRLGEGPPLFLLHGNPGDSRDFDGVIDPLSQERTVFALDWPGLGQSPPLKAPSELTPERLSEALEVVVRAFDPGPADFLGHSVGAHCAVRLALRAPALVRSLVLVDPGGFSELTAAKRLFARLRGVELFARLLAVPMAKSYLRTRGPLAQSVLERTAAHAGSPARSQADAALWRSFLLPTFDLRREARELRKPTLLLWGKEDPVVPVADARRAQLAIRGSKLALVEGGHLPFVDQPAAFLAAVLPFLRQVDAPAAPSPG